MARCYDLRRDDAAVLVHLLSLEDLAPEDLSRSPLARNMVKNLQQRVRPTFHAAGGRARRTPTDRLNIPYGTRSWGTGMNADTSRKR